MKLVLKIALGVIIALIALFVGCSLLLGYGAYKIAEDLEEEGIVDKGDLTQQPVPEDYISNEEVYDLVKKGMTKDDVLSIIGREQTKKQKMEFKGNFIEECWYYGLNVQICFEDDFVVSKAVY